MSLEMNQLLKALECQTKAMEGLAASIDRQARSINSMAVSNQEVIAILTEVIGSLAGDDEVDPGGYLDDIDDHPGGGSLDEN